MRQSCLKDGEMAVTNSHNSVFLFRYTLKQQLLTAIRSYADSTEKRFVVVSLFSFSVRFYRFTEQISRYTRNNPPTAQNVFP